MQNVTHMECVAQAYSRGDDGASFASVARLTYLAFERQHLASFFFLPDGCNMSKYCNTFYFLHPTLLVIIRCLFILIIILAEPLTCMMTEH